MDGWVGGWMDGWESRVKDCLQQSKKYLGRASFAALVVLTSYFTEGSCVISGTGHNRVTRKVRKADQNKVFHRQFINSNVKKIS